ncbi:metal-dependent hydrolase [Jonesiaceae bacterium BS-20]|uniref:Metal-dependent hydrolase n=1 Tax=Jonesiaceae bacterium BS-20 TaxID=3120821 RepID=A0AAU7DYY6_9MICO
MMGKHHAVSGAAAWIAVTATGPLALGSNPLPPLAVIIGAGVTAGAALLPDVDQHNGTIAHSGGLVTKAVASVAQGASGGHRHGLHGILAIVGFYLATTWLAGFSGDVPFLGTIPIGSALLLLALVAFALKALKLSKGGIVKLWLSAFALTVGLLAFAPEQLEWLPLSVMVGVATHLVGDFITTGGLPLFWPWVPKPPKVLHAVPVINRIWQPNGYMAVPVLGNTGSAREWVLFVVLSGYTLAGLLGEGAHLVGQSFSWWG